MRSLDRYSIIGAVAVERPATIATFEQYGIDYAFRGGLNLEDGCAAAGVDFDDVIGQLRATGDDENGNPWRERPLSELVRHIETVEHPRLRRGLQELGEALSAALRVDALSSETTLIHIRRIFFTLREELLPHLERECDFFFPYVRQLEAAAFGTTHAARPVPGSISGPAAHSADEHEHEARQLEAIVRLISRVPAAAGAAELTQLESAARHLAATLRTHAHLENNIVFVRALACERAASAAMRAISSHSARR